GCVVFVSSAVLAINSVAIKKLVAAHEKQLHSARAAALKIFGDVSFLAHANIDSHPGVLLLERGIIANLAIVGQRDRDLMTARAQLVRERIHHVDERTSA